MTDGFWYHGSGKLGGEFCPNKPDDKERYGEYVKVVRCKDCTYWEQAKPDSGSCNRAFEITAYASDFCSYGERKDDTPTEKVDTPTENTNRPTDEEDPSHPFAESVMMGMDEVEE